MLSCGAKPGTRPPEVCDSPAESRGWSPSLAGPGEDDLRQRIVGGGGEIDPCDLQDTLPEPDVERLLRLRKVPESSLNIRAFRSGR
jgi:hypothetical protein